MSDVDLAADNPTTYAAKDLRTDVVHMVDNTVPFHMYGATFCGIVVHPRDFKLTKHVLTCMRCIDLDAQGY